ncbi:MAG: hypothetical protein WC924_03300 [Candidatus Gracilibacteria bacterium]
MNLLLLNIVLFGAFILLIKKKKIQIDGWDLTKEKLKKITPYLLVCLPILLVLLHQIFNTSLQMVSEVDAQLYHLPFAVTWLQNHDTFSVFYSAFAGPIGYYPGNHEIFLLWNILPFGSDILANFVNIPIYLLVFLLVWNFGEKLEIGIYGKAAFLILLFSSPFFLRQAVIPASDVFQAFFLLCSVYYIFLLFKEGGKLHAVLFVAAISIALGTKYSGLIYSLPIIFSFHLIFFRRFSLVSHVLIFSSYCLVGGYFYWRNFIFTGNPIFPVGLTVGDCSVFKGYLGYTEKVTQESLWYSMDAANILSVLKNHLNYLGYQALLLPVAFGALLLASMKSLVAKHFYKSGVYLLLFLSISFAFLFYLRAPWSDQATNIRYASVVYILLWGLLIFFLRKRPRLILSVAMPIAVLTIVKILLNQSEIFQYSDRISSLFEWNYFIYPSLTIIFGLSVLFLLFAFRFKRFRAVYVILFLVLHFYFLKISFAERNELGFADPAIKDGYFHEIQMDHTVEMFEWVKNNLPEGANIAYANFIFPYHLYGRDLGRTVNYVNVNTCGSCGYADFSNSPDSIMEGKGYDAWLGNLKSQGKAYFILGFLSEDMARSLPDFFYTWTEEHPQNFQEIYSSGNGRIYKIVYGNLPGGPLFKYIGLWYN